MHESPPTIENKRRGAAPRCMAHPTAPMRWGPVRWWRYGGWTWHCTGCIAARRARNAAEAAPPAPGPVMHRTRPARPDVGHTAGIVARVLAGARAVAGTGISVSMTKALRGVPPGLLTQAELQALEDAWVEIDALTATSYARIALGERDRARAGMSWSDSRFMFRDEDAVLALDRGAEDGRRGRPVSRWRDLEAELSHGRPIAMEHGLFRARRGEEIAMLRALYEWAREEEIATRPQRGIRPPAEARVRLRIPHDFRR